MDIIILLLAFTFTSIVFYLWGVYGGVQAVGRNLPGALARLTDEEFTELMERVQRERSVQKWKNINNSES